MPQLAQIPAEADGVFEGGGVKGIAFAGALAVAEQAGLRRWKNVAGTSAGAIVASLLATGYDAKGLKEILAQAEYRRFADYGLGGLPRGIVNSLWMRGLAPGRYFSGWLRELIAMALARWAEEVPDLLPEWLLTAERLPPSQRGTGRP